MKDRKLLQREQHRDLPGAMNQKLLLQLSLKPEKGASKRARGQKPAAC